MKTNENNLVNTPPAEEWTDEFDKKWPLVECSAHERTSSAGCICDSLEDINSDYGYKDIKSFVSSLLSKAKQETVAKCLSVLEETKNRFRCVACDGAKCSHTMCCQALGVAKLKIEEEVK